MIQAMIFAMIAISSPTYLSGCALICLRAFLAEFMAITSMLIKSKSIAIDSKKSSVEPPQLKAKVTNKIYAKNKKRDRMESISDKIAEG